jgi:DNA-binding transcriptional ArsR family regulator
MQDRVFQALADSHRRVLLDRLRRRGDQTLTELCAEMPMSRQAVSKHLTVLGQADLVRVQRRGRTRVHTLNPQPLRDVNRWLADYAQLWDSRLDQLRTYLEENP